MKFSAIALVFAPLVSATYYCHLNIKVFADLPLDQDLYALGSWTKNGQHTFDDKMDGPFGSNCDQHHWYNVTTPEEPWAGAKNDGDFTLTLANVKGTSTVALATPSWSYPGASCYAGNTYTTTYTLTGTATEAATTSTITAP